MLPSLWLLPSLSSWYSPVPFHISVKNLPQFVWVADGGHRSLAPCSWMWKNKVNSQFEANLISRDSFLVSEHFISVANQVIQDAVSVGSGPFHRLTPIFEFLRSSVPKTGYFKNHLGIFKKKWQLLELLIRLNRLFWGLTTSVLKKLPRCFDEKTDLGTSNLWWQGLT